VGCRYKEQSHARNDDNKSKRKHKHCIPVYYLEVPRHIAVLLDLIGLLQTEQDDFGCVECNVVGSRDVELPSCFGLDDIHVLFSLDPDFFGSHVLLKGNKRRDQLPLKSLH
jgi:hypothetical protein